MNLNFYVYANDEKIAESNGLEHAKDFLMEYLDCIPAKFGSSPNKGKIVLGGDNQPDELVMEVTFYYPQ